MENMKEYIRQEVQTQIREQLSARIIDLERRMLLLEKQAKPSGSGSMKFSRDCCSFASAGPKSIEYPSYSYAALATTSDIMREDSEFMPLTHATDKAPVNSSDSLLPESMYNYCMYRLAASSDPLRDPALLWWLLLIIVQFCTLAGFVVYNDVKNNAIGVVPPAERARSISNCLFSASAIAGTPVMQYCIGYVAIVLIGSVLRSDDESNFKATFTQKGMLATLIINFGWFWQTVYVPGCFALEATGMFASSADGMAVVMNTLAVTFIMEIDNMLYSHMLSDEAKSTYQHNIGCPLREETPAASRASWAIFMLNMLLMPVRYTLCLVQLGSGKYGQEYLSMYWYTAAPFYFVLFTARALIQGILIEKKSICATFTIAFSQAFLGFGCYLVSVGLACFKILLLNPFPGPYFQWGYHESEFAACADD